MNDEPRNGHNLKTTHERSSGPGLTRTKRLQGPWTQARLEAVEEGVLAGGRWEVGELGALLCCACFDPAPLVRQQAALALMRRGEPEEALGETPELLMRLIQGPGRQGALQTLRPLGEHLGPGLATALEVLPRKSHKEAAAWALAQLGDHRRLLERLTHDEPMVRRATTRALGQLSAPDLLPSAPILAGLADTCAEVRRLCARCLGKWRRGDTDALTALLRTARCDDCPRVRREALWALGRMKHSAELSASALDASIEDPDRSVRAEAANTLIELGQLDLVPHGRLLDALKHPVPEHREAAVALLGRLSEELPRALEALERVLEDPDEHVRARAWRLWRRRQSVSTTLEPRLQTPRLASPLMCWTAAMTRRSEAPGAIAHLPEPLYLDAAEALYDVLTTSPFDLAAEAALKALSRPPLSNARLDLLELALEEAGPPLQIALLRALSGHHRPSLEALALETLQRSPFWRLRFEAMHWLKACEGPPWWHLLEALDDPHWSIRLEATRTLLAREHHHQGPGFRHKLLERLQTLPPSPLLAHSLSFLFEHWGLDLQTLPNPLRRSMAAPPPSSSEALARLPIQDDDPAVVCLRLSRLSPDEARRLAPDLHLLAHVGDGRLRRLSLALLETWGEPQHLALLLLAFHDPRRRPLAALKLLQRLPEPRLLATLAHVLRTAEDYPPPALAWALNHLPCSSLPSALTPLLLALALHPSPQVRSAAMRPTANLHPSTAAAAAGLSPRRCGLTDPHEDVRLAALATFHGQPPSTTGLTFELQNQSPQWLRAWARFLLSAAYNPLQGQQPFWDHLRRSNNVPDRVLAARCLSGLAEEALPPSWTQPLETLQLNPSHLVREAALTRARARRLWRAPQHETSWRVWRKACRLLGRSLAEIMPQDGWGGLVPPPVALGPSGTVTGQDGAGDGVLGPSRLRPLGETGLMVSPLGVSGHYGLGPEGFAEAVRQGVNLFFWEPHYLGMNRFFRERAAVGWRHRPVVVCGSFEMSADAFRREAEEALEALGLERLGVFLLFWVRSGVRMGAEVRRGLEALKEQGLVDAVGLSTHQRPLASRAIEEGWDVVMVRHNAAHRGAERGVFPAAVEAGTGVLAFSSLCHGRMIAPIRPGGPAPPTAAECYRYSLSQPGVSAVFSAPGDLEQLRHNLEAQRRPGLEPERIEALRAFGDQLYGVNKAFARHIRLR